MVPDAADRPDVLPSERLLANGMAIPALRADLRRIDNCATRSRWRRSGSGWRSPSAAPSGSTSGGATCIAFVLMGPLYARFAILMHEAAHKLLFTNKRWNDWIGKWVVAYPSSPRSALPPGRTSPTTRTSSARTSPTWPSTRPTRARRPALRRRLFRDAVGISGWKNFVPLVKNTRTKPFRPIGLSIFGVQALLWAAMWAATGRWWIYPLLWFLPWMTEWRVINRLRSIAEHGAWSAARPPGDDAQRAPVLARPLLDRPLQHRLAPGPPCRHGRAVAQPARLPRRARAGRATSPMPSPTRATGPSGRRSAARTWQRRSARPRPRCPVVGRVTPMSDAAVFLWSSRGMGAP